MFLDTLQSGEYIEYQKSFPKETKTHVTVPLDAALGCFERCALLIDERVKSPITLDIAEDHIHVTCRTANGRIDEEIPVKTEGELMRVGFNNRFLLDALRAAAAAGAEDLELELTSPLASMAIRSPGNDRFLYMVVPMRLTT